MGGGKAEGSTDITERTGFDCEDCSTTLPLSRFEAHRRLPDAERGRSYRQGREDSRMEYRNNGANGRPLRTLHLKRPYGSDGEHQHHHS